MCVGGGGDTFSKNLANSCTDSLRPLVRPVTAMSSMVLCRNLAICNLTFSSLFLRCSYIAIIGGGASNNRGWAMRGRATIISLTLEEALWKVEGRALGNNHTYTGNRNSMNGITTNTENGTTRNMSPNVRRNFMYMCMCTWVFVSE